MVNFASPVAKRLRANHQELVSEAVGTSEWTPDTITQVFCDGLARECGFLKPAVLPVVAELPRRELKYEIVLAARNRAAYELWNDEIARSQGPVLDGDDVSAREKLIGEARELLRSYAPAAFARDQLIRDIQFHRCGDFHARVLRAAVKAMLDEKEWARGEGKVGTARMWKVSP